MSKNKSYTAEDIEVLEGLEPVRHRPGMYIGGVDEKALNHLAVEILDNAMDEAVSGFAKSVEILLDVKKNQITILDNGRGIPVDPHPKFPHKSALEVVLTTLHSGGKFRDNAYQTSGGLHGVGLSVVNALSQKFEVCVYREGKKYSQHYERGKPVSALHSEEGHKKKGTTISFVPDVEIFGEQKFLPKKLYGLAQQKAYLFKGVKIKWSCVGGGESVPQKELFFYPNGLSDYLAHDLSHTPEVTFSGEAPLKKGRIEWAVTWPVLWDNEKESGMTSFCNTIVTPLGGTHESGFRQALLKGIKTYGERLYSAKRIQYISVEDVNKYTVGVISCFISQPQFQGQTKEKLVSLGVSRLVETTIKNHFEHWLSQHTLFANKLLESLLKNAEERLRKKQVKDIDFSNRRANLPGKLTECTSPRVEEREIFIVEGDSAGGSAKQARDRKIQAILPLKGKILNVASASREKLHANKEIKDVVCALGCGIGQNFDLSKLRYHRIIIMTDADVDGAHIASLLLTLFYKEMYALVASGHVYLAQPPLYRISSKKRTVYAHNDEAKDKAVKEMREACQISRFKGLGEMPVQQLKETTMDPKTRNLLQVRLSDLNEKDEDIVAVLMGKIPQLRFNFIQENASFIQDLDI